LISLTDATGIASERTLQPVLARPENRDLTLVASEHFTPGDISLAAQVARVKAAQPDVILCYAGGTGFGTVLHNLSEASVHLPLITSSANISPTQLKQYANDLPPALYFNGSVYQSPPALWPAPLRRNITDMLAAFKEAGAEVNSSSGIAWDPALILVSALRKLGPNATSDQLRDYLLGLHGFAGVTGTYDFRIGDQHGLTDANVLVVKWDPVHVTFPPVSRPGGYPIPEAAN
ncbi:MAG: ABC transporter substrate-binding protein, partial [Candidatus Eremiobacteraeota bacterium]|nr:ABC transporter substrate-binding protein [Candidatus Eremiobacteraeota bacterium]